jgi:homospermidine synthase
VTLNAFDVRSTCHATDVQAINHANSRTRQLRSVGEAAISLQHWFTLFPRDGSIDYRTTLSVTFTMCNRHEFHDLATLSTQVMG